MVSVRSVTREEWKLMQNRIKVWHFERCDRGVIPVKGEFDPTNPNHVPKRKVIKYYNSEVNS